MTTTATVADIAKTIKSIQEKSGLKLSDGKDQTGYRLNVVRDGGESHLGHRVNKGEFLRTLETIDELLKEIRRKEIAEA